MSDNTALAVVDRETGEVLPAFEMKSYLATVTSPEAFAHQQKLSAAYDAACRALIGPNDVQKEGGREFKKKSGFRKLARHFGISATVVRVEKEYIQGADGLEFLATVTARAVTPWGQTFEQVGACCTDEESGRRSITVADAIATAATRAINRAISDVVAMGEVSAEEMNGRAGDRHQQKPKRAEEKKMPFGKQKGVLLGAIGTDDLRGALTWCEADAERATKFADLIATIKAVIGGRDPRVPGEVEEKAQNESFNDFPESLEDEEDDALPF